MDNDRLDELKRRVDELAAVVAELLHANPELLGEHRKPGAGIPGPKEFTKKGRRRLVRGAHPPRATILALEL